MRLFAAQFVQVEENLWFSKEEPYEVVRRTERYYLTIHLFAASDDEAAYVLAVEMMPGLEDANHDGAGDRTNYLCVGLHQLEEIELFERTISEAVCERYGLDIGHVRLENPPRIRPRDELDLFIGWQPPRPVGG